MMKATFSVVVVIVTCLIFLSSSADAAGLVSEVHLPTQGLQTARDNRERPDQTFSQNSGPLYYQAESFDVLNYDVVLDLKNAPTLRTSGSQCTIRFRWIASPDSFRFHLRVLSIDSAFYRSVKGTDTVKTRVEPVKNETDTSATMHYAVGALSGHRAGDTCELVVVYSGTLAPESGRNGVKWGGVTNDGSDAIYALGVGMYNNYVSCTQHWMPCYDLPGDKATLRLTCICPSTLRCVSNGRLMSETTISGNLKRTVWQTDLQTATYLMTFAVGPYHELHFGSGTGSNDLVVYAKALDTTSSKVTCKHIPDMLAAFEKLYGSYPFEKLAYVVTENGSMEHQSLISLARGELAKKDTINVHVAHEMAHQWFGDDVTAYDFRDAWLSESFATYSECAWMEAIKGRASYLTDLKSKISTYMTSVGKPGGLLFEGILPIYDFSRKSPSSNYPQTIYFKGASVMAMLRYLVGDSVFYGSLRDYITTNTYKNASYDSVLHAFQRHVALPQRDSVEHFFTQWIKGKGWPLLTIQTARGFYQGRWQSTVTLQQVQADSFGVYTWFPLELSFKDDSGHVVNKVIVVSAKEQTIVVDSVNNYTSVAVNSGTHIHSLIALTRAPSITDVQQDIEQRESLRVFPNPASSIVWIRVPEAGRWQVELIDDSGRRVLSGSHDASASLHISLDIHDVASSNYVLRLRSANKTFDTSLSITR